MCGLNFSFSENSLEIMNRALAHRGSQPPQSRNGLGHIRLPIQGLSPEFDCPYVYKNWIITYVGEIYNYKEINPDAQSDIQVLAEEWDKKGISAFLGFDGMWAVVIYDTKTGEYHVITDSLAKKPLYFNTRTMDVSSEITPLLAADEGVHLYPNEYYYSCVATWGYCPALNSTPFNFITKIAPFTHMVLVRSQIKHFGVYADFSVGSRGKSVKEEIMDAVRRRLVSDVPVSILCSGGLDSSIIYQLARQLQPDIKVFHIENDESEYLEYLKIPKENLTVIDIEKSSLSMDHILSVNEGPADLGSMVPQYLLSKEIRRQGYDVVLTGDGADEIFCGYSRGMEYDTRYSDVFNELPMYHLPRLDKHSMAHTVELRSPFLSTAVIEKSLAIPYHLTRGKMPLKAMFSDIVPKEILDRKKQPLRYKSPRNKEWRYSLIDRYREIYEHPRRSESN